LFYEKEYKYQTICMLFGQYFVFAAQNKTFFSSILSNEQKTHNNIKYSISHQEIDFIEYFSILFFFSKKNVTFVPKVSLKSLFK